MTDFIHRLHALPASFRLALLACLGAILYWGVIAPDRYVSESHVLLQRTEMASGQGVDIGAMLSGSGAGNRADQMLLRDYLLSGDMLALADARLNLRRHWSEASLDPLSRLWSVNVTRETLHRYYLSRVSVEYDDYAGVLVIKTQAFDAAMAQAINRVLLEEGERIMNRLAHQLAQEQVSFLEGQVEAMKQRALNARLALLAYQNAKGMASPQAAVESLNANVARLEAQLVDLRARRNILLGYLAPSAPDVVEVDQQISAVSSQVSIEQARLAAPQGGTLNGKAEEYQRLQMAAEFTQDVYRSALVALEKGRVEATRTLKKVSVLQTPSRPEYALEPRRLHNIIVFILMTALLAGILHLLAAVIRDHRD